MDEFVPALRPDDPEARRKRDETTR